MSFHSKWSDRRANQGIFHDITSHDVASGNLLESLGESSSSPGSRHGDGTKNQADCDKLATEVAIVDANWTIIAANAAWIRRVDLESWPDAPAVGDNFRDYCERRALIGAPDAAVMLGGIGRIDRGWTRQFRHSCSVPETGEQIDVSMTLINASPDRLGVISCINMTELRELRLQQRRLTRRLLRAQEEERRRVARDLHDTAAQHLVGMSLGLAHLQEFDLPADVSTVVSDLATLLNHFYRDLRGMSFLMHPPMLEPGKLPVAVKALCEGFAARGALDLDLRIYDPEGPGHAPPEAEAAIYRVLQEALGNVQKHAKATRVKIRLRILPHLMIVVISDDGVGLSLAPANETGHLAGTSVGIPGMIARITELGGRLSIHGSRHRRGTSVAVAIPSGGVP